MTSIDNDLGEFSVMLPTSGLAAIEAQGFYYNEHAGTLSGAQLTLRAYADLSQGPSGEAFVNIVTHLSGRRVAALARGGLSLSQAIRQAEAETRAALGVGPSTFDPGVDGTGLSLLGGDTDANAYLFAVGAVLLEVASTRSGSGGAFDATFQQLLNEVAVDLEDDGVLGPSTSGEILTAEASVDSSAVEAHLQSYFDGLAAGVTVPDLDRILDPDEDDAPNAEDNCPAVYNPLQEDSNADSIGDACDSTTGGCGRVDLVFVIDNSANTATIQSRLSEVAFGFVSDLRTRLGTDDVQVLVVDTDWGGAGGSTCSNDDCECNDGEGVACCRTLCEAEGVGTCNGYECNALPPVECDYRLGGGRVSGSGGDCMVDSANRFVGPGQLSQAAVLECLLAQGIEGAGAELHMSALGAAVGAELEADGCNVGFLRPNSMLVFVVLTDEDDISSAGEPPDWKTSILAAKREDSTVALGILPDNDLPSPLCNERGVGDEGSWGDPAPRLRAAMESFQNHHVGSACASDYATFLSEAVNLVETSCTALP